MTESSLALMPEIFVLAMSCVALLAAAFVRPSTEHRVYWLSQLTLVGAFVLTVLLFDHPSQLLFNSAFVQDRVSLLLKLVIYIVSFFNIFKEIYNCVICFWLMHVTILNN